jgi:hypothetical protein
LNIVCNTLDTCEGGFNLELSLFDLHPLNLVAIVEPHSLS